MGLKSTQSQPAGSDGKESAYKAGVPGFDSGVRKIPWRREWQPTPVLLPGEFHRQRSLARLQFIHGVAKSQTWLRDTHEENAEGFPRSGEETLELALHTRGEGGLPFSLWRALHIQTAASNNLLAFMVTVAQQN